jgi:hypothetical protein
MKCSHPEVRKHLNDYFKSLGLPNLPIPGEMGMEESEKFGQFVWDGNENHKTPPFYSGIPGLKEVFGEGRNEAIRKGCILWDGSHVFFARLYDDETFESINNSYISIQTKTKHYKYRQLIRNFEQYNYYAV